MLLSTVVTSPVARMRSAVIQFCAEMFATEPVRFATCVLSKRRAYIGRTPTEAEAREALGCWKCPKYARGCWGAKVEE